MARARITPIYSPESRLFFGFLWRREFLAFPLVNVLKITSFLNSCSTFILSLSLLKSVRAKFLYEEKLQISKYWHNRLNEPMFFPL